MGGIGSNKKISLMNCTTIPLEGDSIEDISKAEYVLKKCAAYRQGMGLDLSNLRPRGSKLGNAAEYSTGTIPWGESLSNQADYVGQCLDGSTKITLDNGKETTIKNIINSNDHLKVKTHQGKKNIVAKFENGKQDLYRLESEDGGTILATKEHKFVIFDTVDDKFKLIELKDLESTDMLVKLAK